ncbi:hypothetical protein QUF74_15115 [Candidatus Halobeggiatoa sp. HSG11]|nr:hypothetical protein [Candidatus Halobeggiatoa sp. HSG11]
MKKVIFIILLWTNSIATELPPLHHPVGISPPSEMQLPNEFRLDKDGLLQCTTCHGIKDIAEIPFDEVDVKADNFFNGGPYQQLTDLCYHCHKKSSQRLNIHKMYESGKIDKKNCDYCHVETPTPDDPPKKLEFRLPKEKICWGCHLKTPHLNALTHNRKVSDKMLKIIKKSEQKHKVNLPLSTDNKVICSTCHTTHEIGVLSSNSASGKQVLGGDVSKGAIYTPHVWNEVYQADKKGRLAKLDFNHKLDYQRLEQEVLLRLSAKNGTLCRACHQFKD